MRRGRLTLSGWIVLVAVALALAAPAASAVGAQSTRNASQSTQNVSRLIEQLKSPELQRRRDAARELGAIKPLPPEAIQALAQVLETTRTVSAVGRYAIEALGGAGQPAIPALTALTKSRNSQARQSAVLALGHIAKHDPAAWPILVSVFKSDFNRSGAAHELANVGPPVIPLLRKALKNKDPSIREGAAETIAQMGNNARIWSPKNPYARREIVFATTADLATAAPELAAALKDPDANVRNQAAIALAYADPHDTRSVPILVKLLPNKNLILHDAAIAALENMGSAAKGAVPALEHALAANPDWVVRVGAARALAKSGDAKACSPLARAVAHQKDGNVQAAAARAMMKLWPRCPQTVPVLIGTLGDKWFALITAKELARIGKPAVPALKAALKNPDLYVREDAAKALAQMKPLTPEAQRALMIALKDKSLSVRSAAATALQNVGGKAERAALAEQKREERIYAEKLKQEMRRYSRKQIMATIPAGQNHKYPLTLAYLFPIYRQGYSVRTARWLITLYSGKDRSERLVFWKKVGDDQFRKAKVIELDYPDFAGEHFETPTTFTAKVSHNGYSEEEFFVDVPVDGWRTHTDQVFVIYRGKLHPVKIEPPRRWYRNKLKPRESIECPAGNSFSDNSLEFSFWIWNADDPMCCPTAGQVVGTYKIIQSTTSGGGQVYIPGRGSIMVPVHPPTTTWRMVVATAHREPIH